MSRPVHSPVIEKDLNDAIDRLVARGVVPNYAMVAQEAGRALGLLSRPDTQYQTPRQRVREIRDAAKNARIKAVRAQGKKLARPAKAKLDGPAIERRLVANSSAIAALLAALKRSTTTSDSAAQKAARIAARDKRAAAELRD